MVKHISDKTYLRLCEKCPRSPPPFQPSLECSDRSIQKSKISNFTEYCPLGATLLCADSRRARRSRSLCVVRKSNPRVSTSCSSHSDILDEGNVWFYFTVCSIHLLSIIFSSVNFNKNFGSLLRSKCTSSLVANRCNALVPDIVCQKFIN